MFINDGKSLFGNTGVIVSLIILVVLLYFSYNKCMKPLENFILPGTVSGFIPEPTPTPTPTTNPTNPPQQVRVNILNGGITLNFTLDTSSPIPKKFLVVLAQYNNEFKNSGNNRFYLSNEYELNSSVASDETNLQTNLCTLVNGMPMCQYSFPNLDIVDANGNLYYYKVGISAIYEWGNSEFAIPYNVNSTNKLFTLDASIDEQDNLFNEFVLFKQQKQKDVVLSGKATSGYGNSLSTADGQYELIKSQLGGYPSHLILDTSVNNKALLSDLIDKSMAQGVLNVNINVPVQ